MKISLSSSIATINSSTTDRFTPERRSSSVNGSKEATYPSTSIQISPKNSKRCSTLIARTRNNIKILELVEYVRMKKSQVRIVRDGRASIHSRMFRHPVSKRPIEYFRLTRQNSHSHEDANYNRKEIDEERKHEFSLMCSAKWFRRPTSLKQQIERIKMKYGWQ